VRKTAALRVAFVGEEEEGDGAEQLRWFLGVQEVEDDAAVPFPSLAWHGGGWWLGSDSTFKRRPWRRWGEETEKGGGEVRVRDEGRRGAAYNQGAELVRPAIERGKEHRAVAGAVEVAVHVGSVRRRKGKGEQGSETVSGWFGPSRGRGRSGPERRCSPGTPLSIFFFL
jgi:hypothetical protein